MNMIEWETFYNRIIEDFKFDKQKDIECAIILNDLLEEHKRKIIPINNVKKIIEGKEVFIFGAGPSLKSHIKKLRKLRSSSPIIAADGACKAFLEENIIPDIIVSDLDGDLRALLECNRRGSIVVVHAHGDNIERIKKYVPKLKNIIGTCQIPDYLDLNLKNLFNFGGFTDGDRCCFLAHHFNAKKLILGGMDFGEYVTKYSRPNIEGDIALGDAIKIKKLKYAKELIEYLKSKVDIEFL